ncbi:t-SNARE [Bombardia bombarda]|uniref:t-SNARE n=1 Tax=Bombardia bombarda TaxID=252184 RepID=A0AA40CDJ5_9PEZI|nr:t-SNARE [Bombardia bombarda]
MSFDQLSSLEAGNNRRSGGGSSAVTGGYSDDPEFQRLSQDLMNQLFRLNGNNARLGGELLEESRAVFKDVGEGVKRVQTWEDVTPTQKYMQQKLSREFQTSLSEFQSLQRQALEKQKASVTAARHAIDADSPLSSPQLLSQSQEQQQQQQELARLAPQDEVDFQDALIIEREEEIRNIEQGVGDLNVLFQQVAQIVTEQGDVLDTIANNVENVRDDTRGADRELRSAARYQKNARSKACCLLLILAVILTIVILAIVLG